jgi:hypothetical protein
MDATVQVRRLERSGARDAVVEPLRAMDWPVNLVPRTLAEDLLVPDLVRISQGSGAPAGGGQQNAVDPRQLQVVLSALYRRALLPRGGRAITEELYLAERGAEGIVARYLEETVATRLADAEALARQVLVALAAPEAGLWSRAETLCPDGASVADVESVLDRLVEAELLVHRLEEGQKAYGFASPIVAERAALLGGQELDRRRQAGHELNRIQAAWLSRGALPSADQLRYLLESGEHLRPAAPWAVLLLRAAVERRQPMDQWLAWFRETGGPAAVWSLEDPDASDQREELDRTSRSYVQSLLGMEAGGQPTDGETGHGPVAAAAVTGGGSAHSFTAALALVAGERHQALDRLEWAARAKLDGWGRIRRRTELRARLADADPAVAALNAGLSFTDRLGVWWWRARTRMRSDLCRIAGWALGGFLGAGLALGLLRYVIANSIWMVQPITHFAIQIWLGGILGFFLALGLSLVGPLLLKPPGAGRSHRLDSESIVLGTLLGALAFGVANLLVALVNVRRVDLVPPQLISLGFLQGLGLSLAISLRPNVRSVGGLVRLVVGLTVACLAFGLSHIILGATGGSGSTLAFAASTYLAQFNKQDLKLTEQAASLLALRDMLSVGVVTVVGTAVGLALGERWLSRWCAAMARSNEEGTGDE